jgi:tetratricopeptide (TPR) repeat protein
VIVLLVGLGLGLYLRNWLSPDPLLERVRALDLARAQHLEAEPLLKQLLNRDPTDVPVLKALVGLQMVADRPAEAEAYLAKWCELEPNNLAPLTARFEIAARVFQQETAIACGRELLRRDSGLNVIRRKLMWIEARAGQLDAAIAHAQEGFRRQPGDVEYQHLLAHAHHLRGETASAIRYLEAILNESNRYLPAVLLRGIIHREQNEPEQALPLLRSVLEEETNPKSRQKARYQLAQALYQLDQHSEAARLMAQWHKFEEAQRTVVDAYQQPENLELRLRAGRLLLESDQKAEGVAVLRQLLETDPTFTEARQLLENQDER